MTEVTSKDYLNELVLLDVGRSPRGAALVDAQSPDESSTVPPAIQVAEDPILTPCKCARPAIATMDYMKHSPDNWNQPEPRINRVCSRCWTHWFGPPEAVQMFISKEWDAYVAA